MVLEEQKPHGVILLLLAPVLTLFYLVAFPAMYLSSRALYFPAVLQQEGTLLRAYTISYGYFLLIGGFLLTFPHASFYYVTLLKFEKERQNSRLSPEEKVELQAEEMIAAQHAELRLKTEGR